MSKIGKMIRCLLHNPLYFVYVVSKRVPRLIPDVLFLRLLYRVNLGRWPNLSEPRRFTEKLQWLKLHDRNPRYTTLVDKLLVKSVVAEKLGAEYVFKVLGVWERAEDIDFESLPERFVLKCNHFGGGAVLICKDKRHFDFEAARRELARQMKKNLFWGSREWPYKNVTPKIFAEEYMEDEYGELRDYKFHCMNGEPKMMVLMSNRYTAHNFNAFDMNFRQLETHFSGSEYGSSDEDFKCPVCFDEMKRIARILSEGIPFVRVDFYVVNGRLYFGELTFYPTSGLDNQSSDEWDLKFGSLLTLPR